MLLELVFKKTLSCWEKILQGAKQKDTTIIIQR